jgi:hypothetical protein
MMNFCRRGAEDAEKMIVVLIPIHPLRPLRPLRLCGKNSLC